MSSKIIKPYFGPTDFRMMREILRRAGYRLTIPQKTVPLTYPQQGYSFRNFNLGTHHRERCRSFLGNIPVRMWKYLQR